MELQKDLVIKRFKKSIKSYDDHALVQKDIVDILLGILKKHVNTDYITNIFEIGSGTGILTKSLINIISKNNTCYYVNDLINDYQMIYDNMDYSFKGYVMGDAEKINYPENMDLIISSSTFQWITNKSHTLKKIYNSLVEKGYFLVSSFSEKNLKEIRKITGMGLNYLKKYQAEELISEYFNLIYTEERIIELLFDDPMQILFHLKSTGVNSLGNIFWKKSDLENFCNLYKLNFSTPEGKVKLTYNPTFYLAKK